MSRFFVLPYTGPSRSAKTMAEALPDGKRIRLEGSTYTPRAGDVIINWGKLNAQDHLPRLPEGVTLLNPRTAITDKLAFFNALTQAGKGDIIPRYWTNRRNIPADAYPVFCRTTGGHAGQGIVIAETPAQLVDAPLYTQYIAQHSEYRVHMGMLRDWPIALGEDTADVEEFIGFQQKLRKNGVVGGETRIKHAQNGYIYGRAMREEVPDCVLDAALSAFVTSGLDFGALDVIYSRALDRAFVLEINTAPDIEGQDIPAYAAFFGQVASQMPQEAPQAQAAVAVPEEAQMAPAALPEPPRAMPARQEQIIQEPALAARLADPANRQYTVVVGVSLDVQNHRMVVEAACMEDAIQLGRQRMLEMVRQIRPMIDVESVSLERQG